MKNKGISNHARLLHSALFQRGVVAELEKWDEHKHIDISIEAASLYLEVDGDDHYLNANTMIRDLKRDYYSDENGYDTIHIPNHIIDTNLIGVADTIAEVVRARSK